MTRQLQDAYIVAATRTPVGKAPRGAFDTRALTRCSLTCCSSVLGAGTGDRSGQGRRRDRRLCDAGVRAGDECRPYRLAAGGTAQHRRRHDRSIAFARRD